MLWIGEGVYEFNKPKHLANWKSEMKITVNGEPCEVGGKACKPFNGAGSYDYSQMMQIDIRALLGGKCRRQEVLVEIEIVPVPPTGHSCSGEGHECHPRGIWEGYGDDLCKDIYKDDGDEKEGCKPKPRYTDPAEVKTYVTYAIAF